MLAPEPGFVAAPRQGRSSFSGAQYRARQCLHTAARTMSPSASTASEAHAMPSHCSRTAERTASLSKRAVGSARSRSILLDKVPGELHGGTERQRTGAGRQEAAKGYRCCHLGAASLPRVCTCVGGVKRSREDGGLAIRKGRNQRRQTLCEAELSKVPSSGENDTR